MSAQEDFGDPRGSDLMLAIGLVYLQRRAMLEGARAYFSAVSDDVAEAMLQTLLIETRARLGR